MQQLAWVPQRPYLFRASILAERPRRAAPRPRGGGPRGARARPACSEVVETLPDGLRHAARRAAARACRPESASGWRSPARSCATSPLLLLDEPTAGLDGATERGVVETIRRMARGRTVVVAAHRPALLALADRVVLVAPEAVSAP